MENSCQINLTSFFDEVWDSGDAADSGLDFRVGVSGGRAARSPEGTAGVN